MAGRTPKDAVEAFVAPIREALGCFADGRLSADSYRENERGVLTYNKAEPTPVFGPGNLAMTVSMQYELTQTDDPARGPWKVSTAGYMYELAIDGETFMEYHWHPISKSHETRPHLHCAALSKGHVPTGRVLVEDFLNYAMEQGAKPRDAARWTLLDGANRAKFALGATWGVGPA